MQAIVPVKSALASKVNWIAIATMAVAILSQTTDFLQQIIPFVPPQYQHYITVGVVILGGIATIITRTFFTTSVTSQSLSKDVPAMAISPDGMQARLLTPNQKGPTP